MKIVYRHRQALTCCTFADALRRPNTTELERYLKAIHPPRLPTDAGALVLYQLLHAAPPPLVLPPGAPASSKRVGARKAAGAAGGGARKASAYFCFVKDRRDVLMAENPGISVPDFGRKCGEVWRAMSEEEKAVYKQRAMEARAAGAAEDAEAAAGAEDENAATPPNDEQSLTQEEAAPAAPARSPAPKATKGRGRGKHG